MPKDLDTQIIRGDRSALTHDQLHILDAQVLPRARQWLSRPGLDLHAMKTLEYWSEAFDVPLHLRSVKEREHAGW